MFTSVSSFLTLSSFGMINFQAGALMALGSLVGIWIGIWLMHKMHIKHYKRFLVIFYIIILAITINKLILG